MADLEELLSRIKKNKENSTSAVLPSNSIEEFLTFHNIKPGIDKLPNFVIYYMYVNYESKFLKSGRIDFFRKLSKKLQSKRNGKQRFYLVDLSNIKFKESYTDLYVKAKYEQTKEYLRKAERNSRKSL